VAEVEAAAAEAAEAEAVGAGGSGASSAGSGKLIRLMSVHPRRRTSASYARAASSLMQRRNLNLKDEVDRS